MSSSDKEMLSGKIASTAPEKGFGFIKPAQGGPDVFFHITVAPDFALFKPGDAVQYTLQAGADKPRATRVERVGRERQAAPPRRPKRPIEMGYVTKLRKGERLGFISADAGGAELLFGAEHVSGKKTFDQLSLGDSVRFCRDDLDAASTEAPTASNVHFWKRDRNQAGPELPENTRARRRKPTWRR
ncbi:MAG: cold shock domain-containing protein [Planctomycetota bacterium]